MFLYAVDFEFSRFISGALVEMFDPRGFEVEIDWEDSLGPIVGILNAHRKIHKRTDLAFI